jgi:hypothetical protein
LYQKNVAAFYVNPSYCNCEMSEEATPVLHYLHGFKQQKYPFLARMCFISLSISIHNSWNFKAGTTFIFRNYMQTIMAGV